MNAKALLLVAATLATGMAQATCYNIYKADGSLMHQSSTSPVDLSLQIGDTVPEKFGAGATMVVSADDVFCKDEKERQKQAPRSLADALAQEEAKSLGAGKVQVKAAAETKTAAAK